MQSLDSAAETASGLMPNFLVIGAAKSGTTSLYHYLRAHPDVYMPRLKEPRFFAIEGEQLEFGGPNSDIANRRSVWSLKEYQNLFAGVDEEIAIGEASPLYLYHSHAPASISRHIPDVKLIAILRNPVERAFSGYVMHVMQGREKLAFEDALKDEPRRIAENWVWGRYVDVGRYSEQLRRYYQLFRRDQLKVILFDDLVENESETIRSLFTFLGVRRDQCEGNVHKPHNVSGIPKSRMVDFVIGQRPNRYWLSRFRRFVPSSVIDLRDSWRERNMVKPVMRRATRTQLLDLYREDILETQSIIDRDLSSWFEDAR